MYVKFCESKFNLTKDCKTISLGTLKSYADDDPNFLRYDYNEGGFLISNFGDGMTLGANETQTLSSGGIIGSGIKIAAGANFNRYLAFPNCYIFCFSENLSPSLKTAKSIDPNYDSWYAISDLNVFLKNVVNLLNSQLSMEDLDLGTDTNIEYLRNIGIQVIHKPVQIRERTKKLQQDNNRESISIIENPIELIFIKEPSHSALKEYRIAFIIVDAFGKPIPVNPKAKILNLELDLGISEITTSVSL